MPVYLSDEKKKEKKKDDVFVPYWLDVEKQRKVTLYQELPGMTGRDFVRRCIWFLCCAAGAVLVSGRSCGL